MKIKILMFATVLSLLVLSCSKDENVIDKPAFTADEATVNAKLDVMNDDLSQVVEENLTVEDGISGKNTQTVETFSPACATITRVPAFGTTPTADLGILAATGIPSACPARPIAPSSPLLELTPSAWT